MTSDKDTEPTATGKCKCKNDVNKMSRKLLTELEFVVELRRHVAQ